MKKFGLSFICGIVMVLFAIVAIILPTATGITASASFGGLGTLTVNWTGYQLIFGDSENKVDMVPGLLVAWIFLLLAALAGIGALVILLLKKDKKVAPIQCLEFALRLRGASRLRRRHPLLLREAVIRCD